MRSNDGQGKARDSMPNGSKRTKQPVGSNDGTTRTFALRNVYQRTKAVQNRLTDHQQKRFICPRQAAAVLRTRFSSIPTIQKSPVSPVKTAPYPQRSGLRMCPIARLKITAWIMASFSTPIMIPAKLGNDREALLAYYVERGVAQGQTANAYIDPREILNAFPDIEMMFGDDCYLSL